MAALERTPEEVETSSRGVSTQIQGLLEARGRVVEVVKSYIPEVTIYTIDCGDLKIKFDIHSKLLKLKQNDEVSVVIGKELPEFRRGVDFLAWGYVISLKRGESTYKMIISLWGYIVIVETVRQDLLSGFNFMDKVYFKAAKSGTSVNT